MYRRTLSSVNALNLSGLNINKLKLRKVELFKRDVNFQLSIINYQLEKYVTTWKKHNFGKRPLD